MFVDNDLKRVFIDVHYEQVFKSMSLNLSEHALSNTATTPYDTKGIYQRKLLKSTVNQMKASLNLEELDGYTVFFDMEHISSIDQAANNEFKLLFKGLSKKAAVFVYNVNSDIISKLNMLVGEQYYRNAAEKNYYSITSGEMVSDVFLNSIHGLAREAFDKRLTSMIRKCCDTCIDGKSPSSCVKLTKYINAKKLLKDLKDAYYIVYKLALILHKEGVLSISDKEDNKDKVLFVHTMNSTVIGAILAQLFGIDLLLVDHLGPYNKLFIDGMEESVDSSKKYIVVTDVVCMGTELSSARTLLNIFGASYHACATIVDIIPVGLTEPEELKIHALYVVHHEHNPIEYTITTDLG